MQSAAIITLSDQLTSVCLIKNGQECVFAENNSSFGISAYLDRVMGRFEIEGQHDHVSVYRRARGEFDFWRKNVPETRNWLVVIGNNSNF